MYKLILNETEFDIISFNRNTYFHEENIESDGSISFIYSAAQEQLLNTIAENQITSLVVKRYGTVVYDAGTISAKITNININIYESNNTLSANIQFN